MDIEALRRLMREGGTVSGAHIAVDTRALERFPPQVKNLPASRVSITAVRARASQDHGEMIGLIQAIYFVFAVMVAFGVVYNSARIALSERSRDLATLRVIGFTHRKSPPC